MAIVRSIFHTGIPCMKGVVWSIFAKSSSMRKLNGEARRGPVCRCSRRSSGAVAEEAAVKDCSDLTFPGSGLEEWL